MSKSDYHAQRTPYWSAIEVIDLNLGRMSVTNDAEAVVQEVVSDFGDLPIMYRDSDGQWDELKHDNGRFLGFGSIGTSEIEEARMAMKERYAR